MIHGYHVILPMYGYWLPNDPRGSWSEFIRKWELVQFGPIRFGTERRALGELSVEELLERDRARSSLAFPPVTLTDRQALNIAHGFEMHCRKCNYTLWACAILPEHTHLVIARHSYAVEQMSNLKKGAASRNLTEDHLHPLAGYQIKNGRTPSPWAARCWKIFLDSEEAIENAIGYVFDNPAKEGKKPQPWPFLVPFAGITKGAWTTYH